MGALLLVRSTEDMAGALRGARELASSLRPRIGSQPEEDLLAICVGCGLDSGLRLRASFSHAGIWKFCWLDGDQFPGARGSNERRRAVPSIVSFERGVFFPVFGAGEPVESVAAELRALQADYPGKIGSICFQYDEMYGVAAFRQS